MGKSKKDVSFCRSRLIELRRDAERHARRFPSLKHMLVLPPGAMISVPPPDSASNVKLDADVLASDAVDDPRVAPLMPPKKYWPDPSSPTLIVVSNFRGDRLAAGGRLDLTWMRSLAESIWRVHAFFGSPAGMEPLKELAADLVDLERDLAEAWFAVKEFNPVFYRSFLQAEKDDRNEDKRVTALDIWLCTVHCWAWKASDSRIHTNIKVVHKGDAHEAKRTENAVARRQSFSCPKCNIFKATAATVELFLRFFTAPPDLRWSVDYPPPHKPDTGNSLKGCEQATNTVAPRLKPTEDRSIPKADLRGPVGERRQAPPTPATETTPGQAASLSAQLSPGRKQVSRIDWHEITQQLHRMCDQDEPYTSLRLLGKRLTCSAATVKKAIDNSPSLTQWSRARQESKGQPRASGLGELVTDSVPQDREPNPADAAEMREADEAEETLKRLMQDADQSLRLLLEKIPREEVRNMTPARIREMVKTLKTDPDAGQRVLGRKP